MADKRQGTRLVTRRFGEIFRKHWRPNKVLSVSQQQSLLAQALVDAFVPFEKFRLSMAYLDGGEEAALAYAQVSTMVDFMVQREMLV